MTRYSTWTFYQTPYTGADGAGYGAGLPEDVRQRGAATDKCATVGKTERR
jgi:hypothetical protein